MTNRAAPSPISENAIRLDWIPMGPPRLRPPAGFSAEQRGWFVNLFWAMFDAERQGYLAVTSDIWSLAGSRDIQRWEAHGVRVMAAFEAADIAGQHVIFFPPLIQALEEQRKKLLRTRGRGGFSKPSTDERACAPSVSLSQSEFDFDFSPRGENEPRIYPKSGSPSTGKRAQREQTRSVLAETLRHYGG
jgi:hypothetical protein